MSSKTSKMILSVTDGWGTQTFQVRYNQCMKILKIFGIILGVLILVFGATQIFIKPSNNRDWSVDNAILPSAEFSGDLVTIRNVRNFSYASVLDYTPAYYDKTYDLSKIKTVDFFNEPFSGLAAHTFLSFGFEDGEYVTVSVEVRREKGEFFNAFKGLFNQFELTYVIADERDVVRLRTNYRKDDVYRFPIKVSTEKARALFVDMLNRANALKENPEFYNTFTNNCTTNIVRHVNAIAEKDAQVPFSLRYIFPKFSDALAYDLGLIDDTGTLEELKTRYNITAMANEYGDDPYFSYRIRGLPPPPPPELLPDIVPLPPFDMTLVPDGERLRLAFSTTYYNQGEGDLKLVADSETRGIAGDIERKVFQHIIGREGGERFREAGEFLWHDEHLHYHFDDFITYALYPAEPVEDWQPLEATKATFCVRDVSQVHLELLNRKAEAAYRVCGKENQGVSVGWGDTYFFDYPDQYLDVTEIPSGVYILEFHANPDNRFEEITLDNNISKVTFRLDKEMPAIEILSSFPENPPEFEHVHLDQPFGLGI